LTAELQNLQEKNIPTPDEFIQNLKKKIHDLLDEGGISSLMNNGLDDEHNRKLLETADTDQAVTLVWKGIATLTKQRLDKDQTVDV